MEAYVKARWKLAACSFRFLRKNDDNFDENLKFFIANGVNDEYITIREFAKMLGITVVYFYTLMKREGFPQPIMSAVYDNKKRFLREEALAYVKKWKELKNGSKRIRGPRTKKIPDNSAAVSGS